MVPDAPMVDMRRTPQPSADQRSGPSIAKPEGGGERLIIDSPNPTVARLGLVPPSDRGVQPLLVTVRDAAQMLCVGRSTLYEMMWSGDVTAIHIGRSVRLAVSELEEFVASRVAS